MEPQKLDYETPPPKKPILRNIVVLIVTSFVKLVLWILAFAVAFFIVRGLGR